MLRAPAVLARWSRLLIDLNRGPDDPTLVMKLSDGKIVPGNRHADEKEVASRLARFHAPYHAAIAREIGTPYMLAKPYQYKALSEVLQKALAERIAPRPTTNL